VRVIEDRRAEATATEIDELLFLLNRVRDAVIRTSEGLTDDEQRTPGVPSGTNLLGLVRHLTAMETVWFQEIFLGETGVDDTSMRVPAAMTRDDVVTAYREACDRSDRIVRFCGDLAALSAGDARLPASTSRDADPAEPRRVSLRLVVAHMLEETSRHAGHADILRERIDGETDL
jgi:uncharacterized damage-inducible protein DinB